MRRSTITIRTVAPLRRSKTIRVPSAVTLGWNSSAAGVFTPAGSATGAPVLMFVSERSRSARPGSLPSLAAKTSAWAPGGATNNRRRAIRKAVRVPRMTPPPAR